LDLKPDNILVDATGRTRILDFGISRAMEADLGISTLAFDRAQVIGTIPYMSPEQAAGRSESLGVAADVYSLGVLAYMLSGGSLPFDLKDLSPYEAVRVIQFEEPPALKGRVPGAAKDLARIAHKAIEKDPARRYGSCEQMAEDLERFVGGEPVRARPSSTWYRASRFVRRHRFLVSGSVTVIAALALALLASFEVLASQARELRFNDTRELPQLKEEARRTRLPFAEQGPWRESWLARAHKLEQRLPSSLATLDEMQSRADSRVLPDGTVELFFEDESEQWWFDNLRLYTEDMIEFTDRTNSAGHLALMEARLKLNATAYQGSIIDAHSEWDEAIQSVSDPAECPLYEGLLITPQLGLVPLGRCTSTGLWEFAHLPTGKPATFEPDLGGLLDPDSGLVLVLIPSAEFLMGAQSHSADYPNYDPSCEDWEKCLLFTQLDPFFISKYEMTGEQWLAIRGAHQPFYTPPYTSYGDSDADCHPVESLSWNQALLECLGMGLDLPSEARWEWAARGGTTTPWFSGADPESLLGFANLGDNFLSQSRSSQWGREDWLNDGHVIHSRVGSYLPNGYGLHDIHGNVGELTKDSRPNYQSVDRSSSGDGLWHEKRFRTVVRGGSFSLGAKDCRITARRAIDHSVRSDDIGLRPCRDIDGYSTYSRGGVPQQENTPAALVRYLASRE
ncbi:MAG: sulfatase activating formylglycine-generating enzyme, partial [Planctomycetota bacterium]